MFLSTSTFWHSQPQMELLLLSISLILKYDFECFGKSGCQLGLVLILAFFTQSLNYVIHGEERNVRKGREGKKVSKPS